MPFEKPKREVKKLSEEKKKELAQLPPKERAIERAKLGAYDDGIYIDDIMDDNKDL